MRPVYFFLGGWKKKQKQTLELYISSRQQYSNITLQCRFREPQDVPIWSTSKFCNKIHKQPNSTKVRPSDKKTYCVGKVDVSFFAKATRRVCNSVNFPMSAGRVVFAKSALCTIKVVSFAIVVTALESVPVNPG